VRNGFSALRNAGRLSKLYHTVEQVSAQRCSQVFQGVSVYHVTRIVDAVVNAADFEHFRKQIPLQGNHDVAAMRVSRREEIPHLGDRHQGIELHEAIKREIPRIAPAPFLYWQVRE
jgi:hypothetical protein